MGRCQAMASWGRTGVELGVVVVGVPQVVAVEGVVRVEPFALQ